MIIAIDFDGTIAEEIWPGPGPVYPLAKVVINKWYYAGHTIIINTCRSGRHQGHAVDLLGKTGIKFTWVNNNDPKLIDQYGMDCRKISADVYIDNKQLGGLPIMKGSDHVVDWSKIESLMVENYGV